MKTPNYKYLVLDSGSADDLTLLINTSVEDGWELVPGQSVAVMVSTYYCQDRMMPEVVWSYTVMMRKLA